jgi:hypothetical protein
MIRAGFLDPESRRDLIELARDGSAAHRLARRANALVLLDQGRSCSDVAKVLLLDDDTVRTWYRRYAEDGFEGLTSFGHDGSACRLSDQQQDRLKAWIVKTLPIPTPFSRPTPDPQARSVGDTPHLPSTISAADL